MFSDLALWQEVALFVLALLSLVYVFYFRIWVALATGSDLLFVAALGVCVTSIAAPRVFELAAEHAVERSPLPEALLDADAKVAALEALPRVLIDRALEKVGYEREVDDVIVLPAPEPGPFETRIRPAVEALMAFLLRSTSAVSSFFLLMMALALRSVTSNARELNKLSSRLEAMDQAAQAKPATTSSPTGSD